MTKVLGTKISKVALHAICVAAACVPLWAAGNGLKGEYFINSALVGSPAAARTDATVDFAWDGSPVPGIPVDYFSVRWTGFIEAPVTGTYQFSTYSNEGIRVWIRGQKVIDAWTGHFSRKDSANPIQLNAGDKVAVRVDYYDTTRGANAKLVWSYPGQAEVAVPQARLYSDPLTSVAPTPVFLSQLTPSQTPVNGWGPYERDQSNGENAASDGGVISIGGTKYFRGLGVHAQSELHYALEGKYKSFVADLGLDDETGSTGTVMFEVWLDGVRAYASSLQKGNGAPLPIQVDVTGKNDLKLVVLDGGDGTSHDHADWAGAFLSTSAATTSPSTPSSPQTPTVNPPATPGGLSATPGNQQVIVSWTAVAGATSYNLYRSTTSGGHGTTPFLSGLTSTTLTDSNVVNNTTYYYKVAAVNAGGTSGLSTQVSAKPVPPPAPNAPTGLTAAPGNQQVTLSWTAVTGAVTYNVYRGTASGQQAAVPILIGITGVSAIDTNGLVNNTTYYYKVAAVNVNGTSAMSNQASAKPVPPPAPGAPTGLTATPANTLVTLSWAPSAGATSYNLYRGTKANGEAATPVATLLTDTAYSDTNVVNGTTYYYRVASVGIGGVGTKSTEASATPTAPGLLLSDAEKDAFHFLRQATWGPNRALVASVVASGKSAFIDQQFTAPPSDYPDALVKMPNMELVSERFFQNGLQGQDQLRQRVAWALSQIFVASAIKVDNTHAMVPFIRMLHARAFDNLSDILHDVTLSPAMGEFLDMVNNRKATATANPNENYAREVMQLFTLGLFELNDDGSNRLTNGLPVSTYSQTTIGEMAKVLTGWTYGDANAGDPTRQNQPYYDGPMKPVARYHDVTEKSVLGTTFSAGQTARQDLDQALALLFNHHNFGPFVVRELIQRLATSNPSPKYIGDVVAVFNNNGQGVRGDMKAIIKAILLHPEASAGSASKFAEPALYILNITRELSAQVVDHPYLTDFSESMSQRIWFAPSVFNYFSPGYRTPTGVLAPELQIWSTATAMTRANFVAALASGGFGSDVKIDTSPFDSVANDVNALVDTANAYLLGGNMSVPMRQAILTALAATSNKNERVRTVLYLIGSSMQYSVEH